MDCQTTLHRLEQALRWAREDPAESPSFRYAMVDNWSKVGRIESADWERLTVSIDDRDFYGEEAQALAAPDALRKSNPSVIIFRILDAGTQKRTPLAYVRVQEGLDGAAIQNALGYGVADPSALARSTAIRGASAASSQSTRHAGREQ